MRDAQGRDGVHKVCQACAGEIRDMRKKEWDERNL